MNYLWLRHSTDIGHFRVILSHHSLTFEFLFLISATDLPLLDRVLNALFGMVKVLALLRIGHLILRTLILN